MTVQTKSPDRSATLAFRASDVTAHLVRAVAAREDISPSDWLRRVVERALASSITGGVSGARANEGARDA